MPKKNLSERDICTQFITPALQRSGWNLSTQVREEVTFTEGRFTALCDDIKPALTQSRTRQERLSGVLIDVARQAA